MNAILVRTLSTLLLLAPVSAAADTYAIDGDHTAILFAVNHLGFSRAFGRFKDFDGEFTFDGRFGPGAKVELVIQTESVFTDASRRDQHLRSPDFFAAAEFPQITFKSTKVEPKGEKGATITGDLTLHGVTKPVSIDVTLNKVGPNPRGVPTAGFSGKTTLKRSDFGMKYLQGAIGDEIEIWLEVEGSKK